MVLVPRYRALLKVVTPNSKTVLFLHPLLRWTNSIYVLLGYCTLSKEMAAMQEMEPTLPVIPTSSHI
jgi:hypothetical protein